MRICIIGPHLLPGSASAIQRTMMMAEGLSEIPEVTVHVIIPRFTSDNERIRSSSVKVEHLYNQNCKSTQIISKKGRWISRFILLQTVVRMNFNCRYDWLMYYSGVSPESLLYALLSKVLGLNYCSHLADPLPIGSNYIHKFKYHAKLSLWKCVLSLSRCVIVISKGMVDIVDELSVNVKVVLIPIMVPSNEMYTNQVDSCSSKTPCH